MPEVDFGEGLKAYVVGLIPYQRYTINVLDNGKLIAQPTLTLFDDQEAVVTFQQTKSDKGEIGDSGITIHLSR